MNFAKAFFLVFVLALDLGASSFQDVITEKLSNPNAAAVVVSASNGKILGSSKIDLLQKKYPPGSLIKVFTAIAFYEDHGNEFPVLDCPPTLGTDPNGCWDRNGHGRVDIVEAIGNSCNVYFRQLAKGTSRKVFEDTLRKFELIGKEPLQDIDAVMVGSTVEWSVSPMMMLRAYAALFNGGDLYRFGKQERKHVPLDGTIKTILHRGMTLSAEKGTSLEAKKMSGQSILGKTGTSLLWKDGKVNWRETQGWWIGLYPADKPKIAVLTFVPKGRGASHAAPLGGQLISWFLQSQ